MEFTELFTAKKIWEWVLILTYDFGPDYFFEDEILNKLRANKNITIVMDEANYHSLISSSSFRPDYLGVYYNLEKVRIRNGGKLHSKIFIMLASDAMEVVVGSANMTESGFKRNLECMVKLSLSEDDLDAQKQLFFAELIRQLKNSFMVENDLIDHRSISIGLKKSLKGIFESKIIKLIDKEASVSRIEDRELYYLSSLEGSLNTQVINIVGPHIEKIHIMSPFYDDNSDLFKKIQKIAKSTDVYIPIRDSSFPKDKIDVGKFSKRLQFVGTEKIDRDKPRFIHAKYYRYKTKKGEIWDLITSANFTSAGMFAEGYPRNYETAVLFKTGQGKFLEGTDIICRRLEDSHQLVKCIARNQDDSRKIISADIESATYDGIRIVIELSDQFMSVKKIDDCYVELYIDSKKDGDYGIILKDGSYYIEPSLEIEGNKLIQIRLRAIDEEEAKPFLIYVNREKHDPNYLPALGASAFLQCVRLGGIQGLRKAFELAKSSDRKDWLLFLLANWDLEKILHGLQLPILMNNTGENIEDLEMDLVPYIRKPLLNRQKKRAYRNIEIAINEMDFFHELEAFIDGVEKNSKECNALITNYIDYCYPVFIQLFRFFHDILIREEKKKKENPSIGYPAYNWLEIYNMAKGFQILIFEHIRMRFFKISRWNIENRTKLFAIHLLTYLLFKYQTMIFRREFIGDCEGIAQLFNDLIISLKKYMSENNGKLININSISEYFDSSIDNEIEDLIQKIEKEGRYIEMSLSI